MPILRKYGWKPSLPKKFVKRFHDHFDILAKLKLVEAIDLTDKDSDPYDQSQLGSCTANMAAGFFQHLLKKEHKVDFTASRLAIYYWERQKDGTVSQDSGASIADAFDILATKGAPPEVLWPYDISKYTDAPPNSCDVDGQKHLLSNYYSLDNTQIYHMKSALNWNYPVGIGFTVYESFESQSLSDTGVMPMPKSSEQVLGGHAVVVVGYDDKKGAFLVRNSWGTDWGCVTSKKSVRGYFWMPYAFLTDSDYVSDCWTGTIAT